MRDKKWVDPRAGLRYAAKLIKKRPENFADVAIALANMVIEFLDNEEVTLVISDDATDGLMATAHPSPAAARREMISCMLDGGDHFAEPSDKYEFLKLVAAGKFKAAIEDWRIGQGVDGTLYDVHYGKVEKNYTYTVAELKARAAAVLEDERRLGRYKP